MSNLFPVLAEISTVNRVFGSILAVLTAILITLVILAVLRKRRRRAGAEKPAAAPAPAVLAPAAGPAPAEPAPQPAEQSLDRRYATHHGQWVCRFCETLNDDRLGLCQACGQPRN